MGQMSERRLTAVVAVSLGVLVMSFAAEAQPARMVSRIGILEPRPGRPAESFRQGLRDLGYVEGMNVVLETRVASNPSELPALVAELVNLKVDVLVTWTTPAALAAARATTTIPVIAMTGDPVRMGLAASLARPGRNVTGIALMVDELEIKKLQLLMEVVPTISRVGVMLNADNPIWANVAKRLRAVAPTLGVTLQELPVTDASQFDGALRSAKSAGVGALLVVEEALFTYNNRSLVHLITNHRMPAIYHQAEFIDLGGLMAFSVNASGMLRRLAWYVDKILRGAKPADLPIQQPTTFDFAVNLKTARSLGLTIPPSILLRANRVVE
jgi:putative ABC transport system substrate-binding protein